MIGFYNYTVILTYLGLLSSVFGIFAAASQKPLLAILFMMFTGLCDMFDGMVARSKKDRTVEERKFGIQIDSLCDAISFGVLPATLGLAVGASGIWYKIGAALFVLCGVIRLAYYNVTEEERQKGGEKRKYYLGMPITMSALLMPIVFCFCQLFSQGAATIYTVALYVVAILFILPVSIPKPGIKGLSILIGVGLLILVALLLLK